MVVNALLKNAEEQADSGKKVESGLFFTFIPLFFTNILIARE